MGAGSSAGQLRAGAPPPMPLGFFGFATALMGIALYLIIEVNVTIFRFFKKKSGLYFWCLLIAAWGTCLHTLAFNLQWWVPSCPWILSAAFGQFGWSFMVTGQSLVLYSRLHLVIRSRRILRSALIMIIVTAIAVEVPNWVTSWFAMDTDYKISARWTPRDDIMLRISQLVLFLQESTLAILYIWGCLKILAPNEKINLRRIKWDLVAINSFIIATDLVNVVLTYTNEHFAKEPIQNFSYAFKLRTEFIVLNQLMSVTSQARASNYNAGNRYVKDNGWNSSSEGASKPQARSRSPYGVAAHAYGSPPIQSLRHHGSDQLSSASTAAEPDLEKLPGAQLEKSSRDDGIRVRHDLVQRQQEAVLTHTTTSTSQPDASSPHLMPSVHAHATGMPRSRTSWWGKLINHIDPPPEERWRRDLSRV